MEKFNAVDAYFETPDGQIAFVPYIHKDQSLTLFVCSWDNSKCDVFPQYKIDKDRLSDKIWVRPPPKSPYSAEQLSQLKLKCGGLF